MANPIRSMAINADADIDAKRELLARLQQLAELSDETGLWFSGRPAMETFEWLAEQVRESIKQQLEGRI